MQQYYFVCHANLALLLGLFCRTRFISRKKVPTNELEYRRIERFIEALSQNIATSNGWIQTSGDL